MRKSAAPVGACRRGLGQTPATIRIPDRRPAVRKKDGLRARLAQRREVERSRRLTGSPDSQRGTGWSISAT
jgi:hypothetical protein